MDIEGSHAEGDDAPKECDHVGELDVEKIVVGDAHGQGGDEAGLHT